MSNVEKVIQDANKIGENPPGLDYNYSYIATSAYTNTIIKRSIDSPYKAFPVAHLSFPVELPFADSLTMTRHICELYTKLEYEYRKTQAKAD